MSGTSRAALATLALAALTACGPAEPIWAPEPEVQRAAYRHEGPTSLTLYTVISRRGGGGAHSALMVNAPSQRVMFDPAGTFYHPHLPERNDVHFGMSDPAVEFYIDYHARITYYVVEQEVLVSPEVAALALQRVQAYGAVPKAYCAASVGEILSGLPGFEGAPRTLFPKALMRDFASRNGVRTREHYDDDPDENGQILRAPVLLR